MADETKDERPAPGDAEPGDAAGADAPGSEEGVGPDVVKEPVEEASEDAPGPEQKGEELAAQAPAESDDAAAAEAKAREEAAAKAKAAAAAKAKAEAEAKRAAEEAAKDPWERDPQDPEWIDEEGDPLVEALREAHGEAILSARSFAGELTLEIGRERIRDVAEALKGEHGYLLPVDVCGVHYPDREEGAFEVVYHLYNFETNRRIRLKVKTDEGIEVPSVTPVWRGANWSEREVYDMFGVRFSDHPDMTRILLWEGFNGFPLRKDFPVEGIDTGTAIYPEYYEDEAGPVAGTGTGWKAPQPPEPEPTDEAAEEESADG